jgi:hypothetical protein
MVVTFRPAQVDEAFLEGLNTLLRIRVRVQIAGQDADAPLCFSLLCSSDRRIRRSTSQNEQIASSHLGERQEDMSCLTMRHVIRRQVGRRDSPLVSWYLEYNRLRPRRQKFRKARSQDRAFFVNQRPLIEEDPGDQSGRLDARVTAFDW